jgi:midasin
LTCLDFFTSCASALAEWSSAYPHLQYLFEPTLNWLSRENATCIQVEPCHEEDSNSSAEALLNSLLFAVQVMITEVDKFKADVHEDEIVDRSVFKAFQETRRFTHFLSLSHIVEQLTALLTMIRGEKEFGHTSQCILPFLLVYQNLAHNQLAIHAQWTRAMFKLDHVLCVTLLKLSKEGFCQPPETEEGSDGEGEALEAADGTGLGEGSGMKNVSEEIEDESQIEGLKGDDTEEQEKGENNGDDNAIEMSEDFTGALEDVPKDGSEVEGEDDESNGSEAGPEDKVENLDPTDPSALDEKIWGNEDGPPDSDNTRDKTDKDFSEEQSGSPEVVAKESKETLKERSKENEGSKTEELKEEAPETEEQEQEPGAAGAPIGDDVQDADTLDLPEDMELDLGEEEKGDNANNELEGEGEGQEQISEGEEVDDGMAFENDQVQGEEGNETQNEDTVNDSDIEMDNKVEAKVDDQQQLDPDHNEEGTPKEVVAHPDTSAGEGDANSNEEAQTTDHDPTSTGQAGSSAADSGQKTANSERLETPKQARFVFFYLYLSVPLTML